MLNTNLLGRLGQSLSSKELVELKEQVISNKTHLLANLKIGDLLEGVITNKIESGYVLALKSGVHIPVSLLGEIEIGKAFIFEVSNNTKGVIHLKVQDDNTTTVPQKVVEKLGFTNHQEMESCIKEFMAKELPLTKEVILNTHYLQKHYQIPSKVLINLLAKAAQLTERDLQSFQIIKNEGINNVVIRMQELLSKIESPFIQIQMIENLGKLITSEDLTNVLSQIFTESEQFKALPDNFKNNLLFLSAREAHQEDRKYIETEKTLFGKDELVTLFKQYGVLDKDILGSFAKCLYEKAMMVDIKANKMSVEEEFKAFIKKILKVVDDTFINQVEGSEKEALKNLRQGLEVLHKLNIQGDYFMLPYLQANALNKGEIYFFEPRKKHSKGEKSIYIVVALDLNSLKHIEVHIHKVGKKISLDIVVESEEIKKHLMKYIDRLWLEIKVLGYEVEKHTYLVQGQKLIPSMASELIESITSLDLKV